MNGYSMRKENELGSIEKGKAAEMVVLNQNLFEIDPDSIINCKVVYTIFADKILPTKLFMMQKCQNKNIVDISNLSITSLSNSSVVAISY